jgi:hypothetical protein
MGAEPRTWIVEGAPTGNRHAPNDAAHTQHQPRTSHAPVHSSATADIKSQIALRSNNRQRKVLLFVTSALILGLTGTIKMAHTFRSLLFGVDGWRHYMKERHMHRYNVWFMTWRAPVHCLTMCGG